MHHIKSMKIACCDKCFCKSTQVVLFCARLVGILPIVTQSEHPKNDCTFAVSRKWLYYSYFLQFVVLVYMCATYTMRYVCGPNGVSNGLEWYKEIKNLGCLVYDYQSLNLWLWYLGQNENFYRYVMSYGYFMIDLDILISVCVGAQKSLRVCNLLDKMNRLDGTSEELLKLGKSLRKAALILLLMFAVIFISHAFMGAMRFRLHFPDGFMCTILDQPLGVFFRGITIIVATIQTLVILMFVLIITMKFRSLAETTTLTMLKCRCNSTAINQQNALQRLNDNFSKIHECLNETNGCLGVQLLVSISSGLYAVVYYLYRYSTTKLSQFGSLHERIHYALGLTMRTSRLCLIIILGNMIAKTGNEPIEALRRAKLINLPADFQQQVQVLMLQWNGKQSALSALDVIQVGPWLIAPIAGNIITYLLVTLQFEDSAISRQNLTALF